MALGRPRIRIVYVVRSVCKYIRLFSKKVSIGLPGHSEGDLHNSINFTGRFFEDKFPHSFHLFREDFGVIVPPINGLYKM